MKKEDKLYKITFIAPYKEMAETAEQVKNELDINVSISVGGLPTCLELVRNEIINGTDVVITRGGTALKIKEVFDIPVIEVEVTIFDIIRAIETAKNYGKIIGIIGFPNVIYSAASLSQFLNTEILEIQIHSIQESSEAVKRASEMGVEVIVGDRIAVETAGRFGMRGVLITTDSHECIGNAYYKAIKIAEVRKKELAKAEEIKIITELTQSGIIAIDRQGIITLFNAEAQKILDIRSEMAVGDHINNILSDFKMHNVLETKEKVVNEFVQFGQQFIVIHKMPILISEEVMGVVATFQKLEHIQHIEQKARKLKEKGHIANSSFESIVGESLKIKEVINKAKRFCQVDSAVLITGETGTGKELFAQSIHNHSLRKNGPFIAVNCAALPYNLLESELFGYVKGAFTGAKEDGRIGLFEQAHEGTIFLDEIGEISLPVQARLLRVLQEGQVQRIGDTKIISVDVRIISATNKNLSELISNQQFREDLFYRINVLNLRLPALRERFEDIPLLIEQMVKRKCKKYKKVIYHLDEDVIIKLCNNSWPGNIRQLENVVERLVIESENGSITLQHLNEALDNDIVNEKSILNLRDLTKNTIIKALSISNQNKNRAAKLLGIDRTTLWRKMKELELE